MLLLRGCGLAELKGTRHLPPMRERGAVFPVDSNAETDLVDLDGERDRYAEQVWPSLYDEFFLGSRSKGRPTHVHVWLLLPHAPEQRDALYGQRN